MSLADQVARGQQLFIADAALTRRVRRPPVSRLVGGRERTEAPPSAASDQLMLVDPPRDVTRWHPTDEPPDAAHVILALHVVDRLAEQRGWSQSSLEKVRRGLITLLAGQPPGRRIRYSEAAPLSDRSISVKGVAEVLDELGLLEDDRPDPLDAWLRQKTSDFPDQMREEIDIWVQVLRGRRGRSRPLKQQTVRHRIHYALPALREWNDAGHRTLREITRSSIEAHIADTTGVERANRIKSLRSLFRHLHRHHKVFHNPAAGLSAGSRHLEQPVPPPLDEHDLIAVAQAAADPGRRLMFVLAAVQGLRPIQMRRLKLDDVDLGAGTLTVGGHARPLGEVTAAALEGWLRARRSRWPTSSNPHLLITQRTANGFEPASKTWSHKQFMGLAVPLERIRVDRQLEELLTCGPDPLHFAAMFGVCAATGIRYAKSAESMLGTRDPTNDHG